MNLPHLVQFPGGGGSKWSAGWGLLSELLPGTVLMVCFRMQHLQNSQGSFPPLAPRFTLIFCSVQVLLLGWVPGIHDEVLDLFLFSFGSEQVWKSTLYLE